jgi:hypothetical protein
MQLGKTLLGALIGGLLGIGLCIAVYYAMGGWDKAWLAIPVALLTGFGVRWMANTQGHPSYARGALTAVIAVAAFLLFYPTVALLTTRGAAARPITAQAEPAQPAEDAANDAAEDATADAPAETMAPIVAVRTEEGSKLGAGTLKNQRPQAWSALDFIALCVAAFIAYELGRGTGMTAPSDAAATRDEEPAPAVTAGQTLPPAD